MVASREHVIVDVTSIDAFIAHGHAPPNAIIMDVQGAELDVLRGASEWLAGKQPLVLFTEFWPRGLDGRHPDGAKVMLNLLDLAGFQLSIIDEKHRTLTETSPNELLQKFPGNMEANLLCVR
jgi:hypothetical protein